MDHAERSDMPSHEHEAIVSLFNDHPQLVAELLRDILHLPLPERVAVEPAPGELNAARPVELRSDSVFAIGDTASLLTAVLEVQLQPDDNKSWVWPSYLSQTRARERS